MYSSLNFIMRNSEERYKLYSPLIPQKAKARLTRPTKSTTAKIMVRVDECSKTNSLSKSPAVPIIIRTKALILIKFRRAIQKIIAPTPIFI
jgi:hypothetical protein